MLLSKLSSSSQHARRPLSWFAKQLQQFVLCHPHPLRVRDLNQVVASIGFYISTSYFMSITRIYSHSEGVIYKCISSKYGEHQNPFFNFLHLFYYIVNNYLQKMYKYNSVTKLKTILSRYTQTKKVQKFVFFTRFTIFSRLLL